MKTSLAALSFCVSYCHGVRVRFGSRDSGSELVGDVPSNSEWFAHTGCPLRVMHDLYNSGFALSEKLDPNSTHVYVMCAETSSARRQKVLCEPEHCNGEPWCFVPNRCRSRYGWCNAMDDQDPLGCAPDRVSKDHYLRVVDKFLTSAIWNHNGMLQTYGSSLCRGENCELPSACPSSVLPLCRLDVYDNALAAIYFTKRGRFTEAKAILDSLAQGMYPGSNASDAYAPETMPSGQFFKLLPASYTASGLAHPSPEGVAVDTGNNAWVGMAFARYAAATGDACAATAARDILHALRLDAMCGDTLGGFMGRVRRHGGLVGSAMEALAGSTIRHYRSIEHNIDVHALARMLGDRVAEEAAARFVQGMRRADSAGYALGTSGRHECDATINYEPVPTDGVLWSIASSVDPSDSYQTAALRHVTSDSGMWGQDTDVVGGADRGRGDAYHGLTFSHAGAGVQWEVTASGVIAMVHYNEQFGNETFDVSARLTLARSSLKRLLMVYGAVPASILGGVFPTGGSDTGFGWRYFRYPHVASTVWTGLALIHKFDAEAPVDPGANPFSLPVQPVPASPASGTCVDARSSSGFVLPS